jgi:alkyl sulfatase BDS1-like metallo-beta-lactamase superfamily hydrolase
LLAHLVVGLGISDVNESYTFHIRNSVAVFTEGLKDNLDIKLIGDSNAIKMTIAGLKKIAQSVDDGDIELAKGDITNAQRFMSIFDYYIGIESSPS